MDTMWINLRLAYRAIIAERYISLWMVFSLGLAIGATTIVFSFANAVLFQPLPYRAANRLVLMWASKSKSVTRGLSVPDFTDLAHENRVFNTLVPILGTAGAPISYGRTSSVMGFYAGANLFHTLGVNPLLGRVFTPTLDRFYDFHLVVISHAFWQKAFRHDPSIIGREILLNRQHYTIVGVMPAGFFFPSPNIEVWLPILPEQTPFERGIPILNVLARLRSGVTLKQGQADIDSITSRLAASYPTTDKQLSVGLFRLADMILGRARLAIWFLLGTMALLMMIACANLAHLLLARGVRRQSDIAIRLAFGATRIDILCQLLTESLLLSLCAGILGILLTFWGVYKLRDSGLSAIPRFTEAHVNAQILLFAFALSLLTGLTFGLLPAFRNSRQSLITTLKASGVGTPDNTSKRSRELLLISEVAFAFILLVSAGLLINSFVRLANVPWGFNPHHVLIADVRSNWSRLSSTSLANRVLPRLRSLPGVISVGVAIGSPIQSWSWAHQGVTLGARAAKISTR